MREAQVCGLTYALSFLFLRLRFSPFGIVVLRLRVFVVCCWSAAVAFGKRLQPYGHTNFVRFLQAEALFHDDREMGRL